MKKVFNLFLIFVFMVSLVGCYHSENHNTGDGSNTEIITITDHAGREVILSGDAKRIVSGYYTSTTLCLILGLKDNLVAIEQKADTRELYKAAAPDLLTLPGVSTKKDINVETTLKQNPDLVILPLSLKDSASSFTEVGVTTIIVNPESETLINESIEFIAKATGTTDRANKFFEYNENKYKELAELLVDKSTPSVYLAGNSSYLETAPKEYWQTSMIELAGGISVSKELSSSGWVTINAEKLITWNPDYIFYVYDADYDASAFKLAEFSGVKAVKNNQIYQIPSKLENWDTTGASAILGVLFVASVLHSDIYTEEMLKNDVSNFYKTFYNLDGMEF